jgi:hypothetical protein
MSAPVEIDKPPNAETLQARQGTATTRIRAHQDIACRVNPSPRIREQTEASQGVTQPDGEPNLDLPWPQFTG